MPRAKTKPIVVKVKDEHIEQGKPGDCWRCAAAMALQAATKDDHANVYRHDYELMIEVHGMSIPAPVGLRDFVWNFDHEREKAKPFEFEIPPYRSPEWKERCAHCGNHFDKDELDVDGYCPECS